MKEKQKKEEKKVEKSEKKQKIISCIQNIIIILIVLFNVVFITKTIKNPNKTPDIFGVKSFVILTGSMDPTIKIGDMVIVKINNAEDYKVGDTIAFREGKMVVVHRIHKIVKKKGVVKYETKGDHNNAPDQDLVEKSDIEGVYKFKIPKIGYLLIFIHKYYVYIIIIILIVILSKILLNTIKKEKNN